MACPRAPRETAPRERKDPRTHDRAQDRRPARSGRLQVHARDALGQARPRDQLLLQPAGRGSGRVRAASGGDLVAEQAPVDRAGGDRRGQDQRRAAGRGRDQVTDRPEPPRDRGPKEARVTTERSALGGRRVLLGVTGGIAAYKACVLVRLMRLRGADVQVVMTRSAERFVGPATFAALSDHRVYTDLWDEPGEVLHVRLARDADAVVVAPATANTIARLASGIADDLLTSTLLEARAPMLLAPAMHSGMWEHAATQANVTALSERGVSFVGPATGALAHGDEGVGRMVEPQEIVDSLEELLARGHDLAGRRIVVTAGPTWEPLDPVRFLGNRSTGKMGFAVASEAAARGAEVVLVVGPGTVDPPEVGPIVHVTTADEMRGAVRTAAVDADAIVMAAAVADFRPEATAPSKIKKG